MLLLIEALRKVIKRMHYPLEVMLICVRAIRLVNDAFVVESRGERNEADFYLLKTDSPPGSHQIPCGRHGGMWTDR